MRWRTRADLYFAGQIVGTEGYMGSTASGLVAGLNVARALEGRRSVAFPRTTMIGALMHYVSSTPERPFQPMKPNFGLLPPLEPSVRNKKKRYSAFVERSAQALEELIVAEGLLDDVIQ